MNVFRTRSYGQNVLTNQKSRKKTACKKHGTADVDINKRMNALSVTGSPKPSRKVDPTRLYQSQLLSSRRYFSLSKPGTYALADCETTGTLTKGYCLVRSKMFKDCRQSVTLLMCSCHNESWNRISALSPFVNDDSLDTFVRREEESYCLHRCVTKELPVFEDLRSPDNDDDSDDEEDDTVRIDQLNVDPLLVAVHVDGDYGLVQEAPRLKSKLKCLTCAYGVGRCDHVTAYRKWTRDNNVALDAEIQSGSHSSTFSCISRKRVPFPLSAELKRRYHDIEYAKVDFPKDFIPSLLEEDACKHGHAWNSDCPKENRWIRFTSVKIFKIHSTIDSDDEVCPRSVYFRPTVGGCACTLEYDGQEDLLLNLDGHNMVYYDVLYHYLYSMVDTGTPLAGFSNVCKDTNNELSGREDIIPLHILRKAWNSFARLLDLNHEDLFSCTKCGPQPQVIICDATSVGVQKNLLPSVLRETTAVGSPVQGSKHKDRVFFKVPATRKLLLQLCGLQGKFRKPSKKASGLKATQLRQLKRALVVEGQSAVSAIVGNHAKPGHVLEEPYRTFISELSRNSPACGTFQIAGDDTLIDIITDIGKGNIDIRQAVNAVLLTKIQNHAPVLAAFLSKLDGELPVYVKQLILDILNCIRAPFGGTTNTYPTRPVENTMSFFPSLAMCRETSGNYEADSTTRNRTTTDECRKESWGHHTLSPGIFTVYCAHGICHGFTILESNESPRHPFQIFFSRFESAPSVIIYDNACKLHQYVLNREPDFFKRTRFFVDRFHWRGHTACSEGYNLSAYENVVDFGEVNSQINEQENAGVQKLKGHLAYMLPDNFKFHLSLYFGIKNYRKKVGK